MGKGFLLVGLVILTLIFCTCEKQKTSISFEDTYGVWADENFEMVRTSKFCITFERTGEKLKATFQTVSHNGDTIVFDDRGASLFDSTKKVVSIKAKDLLSGEELLVDNDSAGTIELNNTTCLLEKKQDRLILTSANQTLEEYLPGEKKLCLLKADGTRHELTLVEKLDMSQPYDMPDAAAENIGARLQEWELGSMPVKHPEGYITGVTINTNRHTYVFYFTTNVVYCRAARIRSNNNGTVFAQNIRMMFKPNEFTASMPENNLAETQEEVVIVDSLFDPKICIFAEDGIYWSLKTFDESLITINGCGEDYFRKRKKSDDEDMLEWFVYQAY